MRGASISTTFEALLSIHVLVLTCTLSGSDHLGPQRERRTTGMWRSQDPANVFSRLIGVALMSVSYVCVTSFFFFFFCVVRADEAAKWLQDHSEDAGGQPAVPSVLCLGKLPGRHGAGGKPGDDQVHRRRDPRQGCASFNRASIYPLVPACVLRSHK